MDKDRFLITFLNESIENVRASLEATSERKNKSYYEGQLFAYETVIDLIASEIEIEDDE